MEIKKLTRDNVQTLRAYIDDYLMDIEETLELRGVTVELGNCSYDEAQATFKLHVKVTGAETREQKALKMYAQLDGIDLDKEHPRYKLVEYHPKKHQYPYIYIDKTRPNVRYKGSTDWAKRTFATKIGKPVKVSLREGESA